MRTPRRPTTRPVYEISIVRAHRGVALTAPQIRRALRTVLAAEGVAGAEIAVSVLSDAAIREVNRSHLNHDYATDAISFLYAAEHSELEADAPARSRNALRGRGLAIEGEVLVSGETALREAPRHGWDASSELLLYIVHGLLHLCGYDDLSPGEKRIMRARERWALGLAGIECK
ncbi:MAG: rRNA maturation RNase YbeY [Planctomyces sp.]|nr:rRNA maturation RNase YbeY [Planctomyces sp.]